MIKDFTIVLPVRDTPDERDFLSKSLPAAIQLGAAELIVGLDAPADVTLVEQIMSLAKTNNYADRIRIIQVEKTPDWNFHLAKIVYTCYKAAKYAKIFSYDVDSIPTKNILDGFDQIGQDGVSIYSFTKRQRLKSLSDLIRYIFYRYRVMTSDYVFSGNYWIDRDSFFLTVDETEYRSIHNGVDAYITEKTLQEGKYRIITSKKIGVIALTLQNEDYPWRQFQLGLWLGANLERWASDRKRRRDLFKQRSFRENWNIVKKNPLIIPRFLIYVALKMAMNRILDEPTLYVYLKTFIYQHPYLIKGYKWARQNPEHEVTKLARTMTEYEWGLYGGKYIKGLGIVAVTGTGSS